MAKKPVYRRNLDDAPRAVAVMAKAWPSGSHIPYHMHRRGQLLYAVSGVMRVETDDAAWIVPPARAVWLPPRMPHSVAMRSHLEMRTLYIDPSVCTALPRRATFVEVGSLLRALVLAALDEPPDYDEKGRGGLIARLILTELARMREQPLAVPIPKDARVARIARALLQQPGIDHDLDRWADEAGASRRTLARLFRHDTGLSFTEWRARLRAMEGLARLSTGDTVAASAAAVGYASPSAFSAMVRRTLGEPPRQLVTRLT